MTRSDAYATSLTRAQRTATVIAIIGLVASIVLVPMSGGLEGFFESYLYAFIFWVGLTLGHLFLLMLQHVAGGPWGAIARRFLEAGAGNILVMAVLFIPVLIGMGSLYIWTDAAYVAAHHLVELKKGYLNVPFFVVRSVVYFAIWIALAYFFQRWSKEQDLGKPLAQKMRNVAAPGIILYILTMTFAAIDWGMSLTPEWFSGMYGVIFMIGQAISAVALVILMLVSFRGTGELSKVLNDKRLQDFGNFLMAFTMFWAYVQASQLIILWSNNVVETNTWYVTRLGAGWGWVGGFLLVFHFAVPFLILFSRWVKQKGRALVWVALWMLIVRLVDLYWIIIPSFERGGFPFRFLDLAVVLTLGGVWFSFYFRRLRASSILPAHDPRLEPELAGVSAHD
jgi:hypothetical protein